ncbi:hypothetical protein CEXT_58011 [Caerostris extrusa]|uniref:Uncharacterized protein n=1 Tax=Caerostris extrusa TaxID=172846 RepID=A0AAV4R0U0_CAEEX|nr:hypothetical protein CEXT_58011 [Caerostris extrusa]
MATASQMFSECYKVGSPKNFVISRYVTTEYHRNVLCQPSISSTSDTALGKKLVEREENEKENKKTT